MKTIRFLSRSAVIGTTLTLLVPARAHALEPLSVFLEGAKSANFDARELALVAEQRHWERETALGRLLPALSARGAYTFNQFEAAAELPNIGRVVITPQNQLDGSIQLDVPVFDLAGHHRVAQATHLKRAAAEQQGLAMTQVESSVARVYYTLIGSAALVEAATRSVELATDNLKFIETRAEYGAATNLDIERAKANVERARQDVADAVLARDLAARQLETISGLMPTAVEHYPEVMLDPPQPLETWLENKQTPADKVQSELSQAAVYGRKAAKSAFVPTVSVNGNERFTNAAGFFGQSAIFTLQAVVQVRLDYSTYASTRAQEASVDAQTVRSERVRRSTEDSIFEAYQRVQNGLVKCEAARAQAQAANKAALLADQRFRAGAATELDVTQSQRDAFVADVNRVRADVDLAFARVQLVTLSGKPLGPELARLESTAKTDLGSSSNSKASPTPDVEPSRPSEPPADPSSGAAQPSGEAQPTSGVNPAATPTAPPNPAPAGPGATTGPAPSKSAPPKPAQ